MRVRAVTARGVPRPLPPPSSPTPSYPPELSIWFLDIFIRFHRRCCRCHRVQNINNLYLVPPIVPPRIKKLAFSVALHAPFEQTDEADCT